LEDAPGACLISCAAAIQEATMKSDRPLIASVLSLAAGLSLILSYCTGSTNLSAAYPLSTSTLHFDITTTGPAALGGIALCAVGLLLLVWALLAAIVGQLSLLAGAGKPTERLLESVPRFHPKS
jgi:hypothetical protein